MKIKLPGELKKTTFAKVLTIDMNDFDIDVFLPMFFFRVLADGADTLKRPNDPERLAAYLSSMAEHPALIGFADANGRRILERLARTALIKTGGIGRGRQGEQISAVTPLTILSYKSGFPKQGSRQRGVDTFLYHTLIMASEGSHTGAERLRDQLVGAFGKGVTIGTRANWESSYDGVTALDTLTRLSMAFLDGLQFTPKRSGQRKWEDPACPSLAQELGIDILKYLYAYGSRMPTQALAQNLIALINFEVFIYTLKLAVAISALTLHPDEMPPAMQDTFMPSPPAIYMNFIEGGDSLSQRISQACVRRDAESFQRFLSANLLLRDMERYADRLRRIRASEVSAALGGDTSGPHYLQRLLQLRDEPKLVAQLESFAHADEDDIVIANTGPLLEDDLESARDEVQSWLDEITQGIDSEIERVVALQVEGVRDNALGHYMGWLKSVGGLNKPYGLLVGDSKNRTTWRYTPTNDLLAVLVQLAAIRSGRRDQLDEHGILQPQPIRLRDFLAFLDRRFGVLIDRAPTSFASAESAEAADNNLRAMLGRLRQMGVFDDLSDDFSAQRLRPTYSED